MSVVTNTILIIPIMEDEKERIKEVNTFFPENTKPFIGMDDESLPNAWYGGTKYLETNIYLGAFNYLDLEGLIKHLKTIKWEEPENVQLIIQEQEDDKFRIIDLYATQNREEKEIVVD